MPFITAAVKQKNDGVFLGCETVIASEHLSCGCLSVFMQYILNEMRNELGIRMWVCVYLTTFNTVLQEEWLFVYNNVKTLFVSSCVV